MTAKVRVALFVAVSLVLSGTAIGQTTPRLTSKQKKERIKALPDEERKWLTEYVEPIILPEEENLFLQLTQPHQWEMFKAEFWKRRELSGLPSPYGPGYQLRYEHFRDVAATDYDGLSSDAGRMVVHLGEPAGIENLSSCGGFRQPEIWSYQSSNASSSLVRHLFYRPSFGAPRRLWTQGDRGIFEDSRVTGFDQLCAISQNTASCSCGLARIASEISTHGAAEVFAMGAVPKVSTEGLDALWERLASSSTPDAKPITVGTTGDAAAAGNVQKTSAAPGSPARRRAQVADGVRRADPPAGGGEGPPRVGAALPARRVQEGFLGAARQARPAAASRAGLPAPLRRTSPAGRREIRRLETGRRPPGCPPRRAGVDPDAAVRRRRDLPGPRGLDLQQFRAEQPHDVQAALLPPDTRRASQALVDAGPRLGPLPAELLPQKPGRPLPGLPAGHGGSLQLVPGPLRGLPGL